MNYVYQIKNNLPELIAPEPTPKVENTNDTKSENFEEKEEKLLRIKTAELQVFEINYYNHYYN